MYELSAAYITTSEKLRRAERSQWITRDDLQRLMKYTRPLYPLLYLLLYLFYVPVLFNSCGTSLQRRF
jgi:hypothetical protein